jgi:hypothetical protein
MGSQTPGGSISNPGGSPGGTATARRCQFLPYLHSPWGDTVYACGEHWLHHDFFVESSAQATCSELDIDSAKFKIKLPPCNIFKLPTSEDCYLTALSLWTLTQTTCFLSVKNPTLHNKVSSPLCSVSSLNRATRKIKSFYPSESIRTFLPNTPFPSMISGFSASMR